VNVSTAVVESAQEFGQSVAEGLAEGDGTQIRSFKRISTFLVCSQIDDTCDDDTETVAEILSVSDDGNMLVYSDASYQALGFVDISDPYNPTPNGTIALPGEPTSVTVVGEYVAVAVSTGSDFVNTDGELMIFEISTGELIRSINLGGQPDAVAKSPDGSFMAVAIENERDEDLGDGAPPQMPAGFLVVINGCFNHPALWAVAPIPLTGLDGMLYPEDPEPEFLSINEDYIAAITLQENNGIVLVDLPQLEVITSFYAGDVNLTQIDTVEEGVISPTSSLTNVPREPDGIVWIDSNYFATADEGDLNGGSRGFTIFNKEGEIVYTSGNDLDVLAIKYGHYPDERSGNKGNEPENVAFGEFGLVGWKKILFVNSERVGLSFVYDVQFPPLPRLIQVLPTGVRPEGGLAIPKKFLYAVACETDDRGDKIRSSIMFYEYGIGLPDYPTLESADRDDGTPIPWGAMSGLAAGKTGATANMIYAIDDSFYKKNRIFVINTVTSPPKIVDEIYITDADGVFASFAPQGEFSADDLAAMINEDGTVNIDSEGIAVSDDGGFWVVSEGSGTIGDADRPITSLNFLFKVSDEGVIQSAVTLPAEVNNLQFRFGFEGVAEDGDMVTVVFQRAWIGEENPRIGCYSKTTGTWAFLYYPLDEPTSQNGGWVGLSDIAPLGDSKYYVLERDNQGGPDAAIKAIYEIDISGAGFVSTGSPTFTVAKTLVRDLMDDLVAPGGLVPEKVEGLAVTFSGKTWIINDNDGVDGNSGETQFLNLGSLMTMM